jgi:hypothetical protein
LSVCDSDDCCAHAYVPLVRSMLAR